MENPNGQPSKKNSNVIYFLIVVVLALLATDVYLYLQKNKSDTRIVTESTEKTKLQKALDSLKDQLDLANAGKTKLSADMQAKDDSLESKIKVLQTKLNQGKLTQKELNEAKEDINQLKYSVTTYEAQVDSLKKQNNALTVERDTLKTNLTTTKTNLAQEAKKDTDLTKQNAEKAEKIKVGSAIKVATANIVAYKIRGSGKEIDTKRSSVAKKIKINFNIATNDIAEKGMHDIYVRVVDPTGNLITESDSGNFTADGQDIQFTYKSSIDFKNDNSVMYTIDWVNPVAFQKGSYTVLLYADGYTMGKSSFELK
jgi:predicted RNase H-like nuclease (RuvC/YqgF family)